jgi:hypothetical protein
MSLVTRILPPDEKGSKLTFQEMDNNLYYLQSIGVSGLTFSANTLTITNPTGGTKSVIINTDNTFTGGTVSGSTIFTNGLSANTLSTTTIGAQDDCIDDIYISNIHSCSPLNINPLDEGNVYFGSTSGVTIDVINNKVGVGTNSPNTSLELVSDNNTSIGNILRFRNSDTVITSFTEQFIGKIEFFSNENSGGGTGVKSYIGGIQDGLANSSIIFATTGGTGSLTGSPTTLIGEKMRIDSVGNVGIGTNNPSERLDVNGKTKTTTLQITSGATNGYVLTSDASGNASWEASTGGGSFTGGTINGLTASTISATTYQNLPLDVNITGGTYSAGTITFTNTTGGTFNVTGITSTPIVNYTIYKVLLSFNSGTFTIDQLENTIGDGSNTNPNDIQWSNPGNGVLSATKIGAFSSSNVMITVSNINSGGVPYICTAQKATNNVVQVSIFLHDGTQLSTPNFNRLPFEIRIY